MPLEANSKARVEYKRFVWKMIPENILAGMGKCDREVKEANSGCVDR